MSVFEFHAGAVSAAARTRIAAILETMPVINIDAAIGETAAAYWRRFQKSHGVGIGDALIAGTAIVSRLPLITLNIKHFPELPDVRRPYGE